MPGVDAVCISAGEFVRGLKAKPVKDICVLGGGDLGRSSLGAGVIDDGSVLATYRVRHQACAIRRTRL
jgi:dihydrofolate reductase